MVSCGMTCMKYLLFFFNLLFAIAGAALIGVGSLAVSNGDYDVLNGYGRGPAIAIIVIGCFVFCVAFLGCCGAITENYCMLITFSVILIVILIAELSIAIAAAVYKDSFGEDLKNEMQNSITKNFIDDSATRTGWGLLQSELKCCGVDGKEDWYKIFRTPSAQAACCDDYSSERAGETCLGVQVIYEDGCYEKVKTMIRDGLIIIMGTSIGIAFIEIVGAILACFLAKSTKKGVEEA